MSNRRLAVLIALVTPGAAVVLLWAVAPGHYELVVGEGQQLVSDLPDSVVVAAVSLVVILTWIAAMMLAAKLLYWSWRQIDSYVLGLWDLLLPESPIVRFGVGITLMIALFIFGPLVVIQAVEITSDDPINSTDENETANNETATNETADNETVTVDVDNETAINDTVDGTANRIAIG